MKIHHTGYLSGDMERSVAAFTELGYRQVTGIIRDDAPDAEGARRNVLLCFLENGGALLELVSPIDESSQVYNRLKTLGEGPYHLCFEVDRLDTAVAELKERGWRVLRRPRPAVAFGGSPVAFLVKKGAGMIELKEPGGLPLLPGE